MKTAAKARPKARTPRVNEEPARELDFTRGDGRYGRVGDQRPAADLRKEYPPQRVRESGRSGGELPEPGITADDLSPETLLDEERSRSPDSPRGRAPLDTALRTIDDTVVGDGGAGFGSGADEAEQARREPVGAQQGEALRRKSRAHARDANFVEPHETEQLADAARAPLRRSGR